MAQMAGGEGGGERRCAPLSARASCPCTRRLPLHLQELSGVLRVLSVFRNRRRGDGGGD